MLNSPQVNEVLARRKKAIRDAKANGCSKSEMATVIYRTTVETLRSQLRRELGDNHKLVKSENRFRLYTPAHVKLIFQTLGEPEL